MHTLSMTFQSHMSIFSVELTLKRFRTRLGIYIYMIEYGTEKKYFDIPVFLPIELRISRVGKFWTILKDKPSKPSRPE